MPLPTYTHTLDHSLDEVRRRARMFDGRYVWETATGLLVAANDDQVLPIPGKQVQAQDDLDRVLSSPMVVDADEIAHKGSKPTSPRTIKTRAMPDGRIVRANGSPWVSKSNALTALKYLRLEDSHWLVGRGNESLMGRAWWIEQKPVPSMISLFQNEDSCPINMDYRYTLERLEDVCDLEWSNWCFLMKGMAKAWNARVFKGRNLVGFKSERDYRLFLHAWKSRG